MKTLFIAILVLSASTATTTASTTDFKAIQQNWLQSILHGLIPAGIA